VSDPLERIKEWELEMTICKWAVMSEQSSEYGNIKFDIKEYYGEASICHKKMRRNGGYEYFYEIWALYNLGNFLKTWLSVIF
jgi:hypothetical protein